jgi:hypothetical protein
MTRFKIISAAAMLSMMIATPVFAQAAIQEPGAYAFYHPNGDVLEANRPWPRESLGAMAPPVPSGGSGSYAYMNASPNGSACAQRYRSYDPASGTYRGYDGNRHPCQ